MSLGPRLQSALRITAARHYDPPPEAATRLLLSGCCPMFPSPLTPAHTLRPATNPFGICLAVAMAGG